MRQQLRQLFGDTAIYGVTTIVQRFLSFLLTPFYTHFLLPSELGIQANVFSVIAFLMVVGNAGMEAAFFKFFSIADDNNARRSAYWHALLVSWLSAGLLGGSMILLPGVWNTVILNVPDSYTYLIRMAGGVVFMDAAAMVGLGVLRMQGKAKRFGAIKVASITVNLGLNILFVAIMHKKVDGIFTANLVQSGLQLALTLPVMFSLLPIFFDRDVLRQMLKFGLPTIASGLAAVALQVVDRPIMQRLAGNDVLGLYQANYRLGTMMMMLVSMFEFAWRPFFLQEARKPNARELYARVFTYFNLVAAAVFLVVSFYIVNLAEMPIPFRNGTTLIYAKYWSGLVIVPIILSGYIFNGWYTNFIAGVYIEKKTSALVWLTAIGAGTNALLCLILIPRFTIIGGAWATWIAYLVMALSLLFYIRRYYAVPYEWGRVGKLFITMALLWWVNAFVLDYFDISLRASLIRFGLLCAFPLLLWLLKFFRAGELKPILDRLPMFRKS